MARLPPSPRGQRLAPTSASSGSAVPKTGSRAVVPTVAAAIVLITALAAVVMTAVIVRMCRRNRPPAAADGEPKGPTGTTAAGRGTGSVAIGGGGAQNGCVAGSTAAGRHVVYFVASGTRSPEVGRTNVGGANMDGANMGGAKTDTVVEMRDVVDSRRRQVALFPERNVNGKGQLRVYRWEDF